MGVSERMERVTAQRNLSLSQHLKHIETEKANCATVTSTEKSLMGHQYIKLHLSTLETEIRLNCATVTSKQTLVGTSRSKRHYTLLEKIRSQWEPGGNCTNSLLTYSDRLVWTLLNWSPQSECPITFMKHVHNAESIQPSVSRLVS